MNKRWSWSFWNLKHLHLTSPRCARGRATGRGVGGPETQTDAPTALRPSSPEHPPSPQKVGRSHGGRAAGEDGPMADGHRTPRPASPAVGPRHRTRVAWPCREVGHTRCRWGAEHGPPPRKTGRQVLGCQHAAPSRVDAASAGLGRERVGHVCRLYPHPRRGSAPRAPWGGPAWTAFTASALAGRVGGRGPGCRRRIRPSGPTWKDSLLPGSHTRVRDRAGARSARLPGSSRGRGCSLVGVRVWKVGRLAPHCRGPCVCGTRPVAPPPQEPSPGPVTDPVTGSGPRPLLQGPRSSLSPATPPPEQLRASAPSSLPSSSPSRAGRLPAS